MTKELRAMLQKLDTAKQEVRTMLSEDKTTEAKEKMAEVRTLQEKVDLQRELEEGEARGLGGRELNDDGNIEERDEKELESEYRGIFLSGLRRRPISLEMRSVITEYERRAVMNEGGTNPAIPDGDSSLLVPKDVKTAVNAIIRTLNDLTQYVRVEGTTALSGSRVLEKDEDMVPFALVDEYGALQETDNPKFVPVSYAVKKRGGFLPLTNDLLKDTDQNLVGYVTRWIGKKSVVTRNKLIIDLLKAMAPKDLANLKALQKVLNVDLDPAISASAILLTNQDGYNWMDEQVDANGKGLLTEDITQPGRKLFKGRPIAVVSNKHVPSITGATPKAPIWVGNLQELIVLFSREFYELASTKEGGDAWRRDTTEMRTIIRDDIKMWDTGAAVYGQLTLS